VTATIESPAAPLLEVRDLRVSFATPAGAVRAVDGVSFDLARGEVLALVGESGSGKSVTAMSLIGLTRGPHTRIEGTARLGGGEELIGASDSRLRRVRGAQIAMVFQDPMSCLNPVMRVGEQIAEQILAHDPSYGRSRSLKLAGELMERVEIPRARERVRAFPHELSGGMRQRVMIAMALSLGPKALLADEPTTALDVTVQAQMLKLLGEQREAMEMGMLLITHDFAVVAGIADRIAVMKAGRIVEQGSAHDVLGSPAHDYTRKLLDALRPPRERRAQRPTATSPPLVRVRDLEVRFGDFPAVAGVSLDLGAGETLGVVGESGSGKTTLIRAIARLEQPAGGTVSFDGADITRARGRKLRFLREATGMVFQDPQASLNPRLSVGATLQRSLRLRGASRAQARTQTGTLLERVGLPAAYASRYPHELSGGERQRVAIARAIAGKPRLLLLDEPVSSLDASLRRGVIELLAELQDQLGCAYVLVSHDLAMVEGVADRVAVMRAGRIVEAADTHRLFARPEHPYTRELLASSPALPQWRPAV
jgi:peptide/nickel transport system ATP-binding protein